MCSLQEHIERERRARIELEAAEDPTPHGGELVTDPGDSPSYQNMRTE
ncbi:hypothetical protein [Arthrobacter sp. UYCu723]